MAEIQSQDLNGWDVFTHLADTLLANSELQWR